MGEWRERASSVAPAVVPPPTTRGRARSPHTTPPEFSPPRSKSRNARGRPTIAAPRAGGAAAARGYALLSCLHHISSCSEMGAWRPFFVKSRQSRAERNTVLAATHEKEKVLTREIARKVESAL